MYRRSLRGTVACTGAVAVAAGLALTGTPASAVTTAVNFTDFCAATSVIGNVDKPTPYSVTVDAPAQVNAGQTFTYRVQNLASAYPDKDSGATTTNITRLKADYAIPDNATFVSAAVVPGTGFNTNTGVAPNVLRVNTSGAVDANGSIVRLSGNNAVIANGTSNSTNSEGGIVAAKTKKNLDGSTNAAGDSWFQLPAVDITVVAGAPGVIQPKIRTAGNAALYNNNENWYTLLAKASLLGTQWAPTRCVPSDTKNGALNAGAGPLATINVVAADVATTTTLTAPATATTGVAVDLTANVAPNQAGGTVQFKDGANNIGAPVAVTGGVATLSQTFATSGAHSITAVYSGASGFITSTSAASVVNVTDADVATTTTLTAPATVTEGVSATLSAAVSPAASGGSVEFFDGATSIGTAPVTAGGATLAHTFATAGGHSVKAVYSGAAGFLGSTSATQSVNVTAADVATTTTLFVPATATQGQSVVLSTTVAPAADGGSVEFFDGATSIGTAPVTAGGATLAHTFTTTGGHSVKAVYSGAAGFLGSTSGTQSVNVEAPAPTDVATTTTLTTPGTATQGQSVALSATVAPTATGTVEFFDGAASIGSSPVTAGVATLAHTFTSTGAHSVKAVYSGAAGFLGSTSAVEIVTVEAASPTDVTTTTSVTAPANATQGTSVTLSAAVVPGSASGTVQFYDNGVAIGSAKTVSGGAATLSHSFTTPGAHVVTAKFTGDAGFTDSSSNAKTVTVTESTTPPTGGNGSFGG